jgi:hypothetical protein
MILKGTISIVGEAGNAVPVEFATMGDRFVVRTPDGTIIGNWRHSDISARQQGHSFWVEAEGERVVLSSPATEALAEALGPSLFESDSALIACPMCGHQVSPAAQSCPNCGHPVSVDGSARDGAGQARPTGNDLSTVLNLPTGGGKQGPWAWLTLGGGVGLIVGSFLPWVTATAVLIGTFSVSGMQGDGVLTLGAGLVVAVVGALGVTRGVGVGGIVTAFVALALAGVVGYIDFNNVSEGVAEANTASFGFASVGVGLWLVMASVVIGFVGASGLVDKRRRKTPTR